MKLSDSQNYINNQQLVAKLMGFVDLNSVNTILEIGPGRGIITDALIRTNKEIISIEADRKLFFELQKKYEDVKNISLIQTDFLRYSLPDKPFTIVSNIPFNITANIVRKITDDHSKLQTAYLIMQKDAAIKFLGAPHAHSPLLSHFLNINFEIKWLMDINKINYSPRPRFDTSFISIKKRSEPVLDNQNSKQFKNFLVYIFERHKPLAREALKSLMSNLQVKIILENLKIDGNTEIKKIVSPDWLNIFKSFISHAPEKSKIKILGSYDKLLNEQSHLQKINRTRKDS